MSETTIYKPQEPFSVRSVVVWAALFAVLVFAPAMTEASVSNQVNVNTAGVEELAALPGIGESKAQAIVEERERVPFAAVDDLERVSGIGAKTVEALRGHVTVGDSGPQAYAIE